MAGKKKSKASTSQQASSSAKSSKKSTRATTAKQGAASTANVKATDTETVTYGVVPSEYNIQAVRTRNGKVATPKNNKKQTRKTKAFASVESVGFLFDKQIEWLTAPPSSGDKKSPSNSQPPLSKKPQRGYHHDVCDGCGEGECLMYCDKCPAAYHCICDDPPLPPEDYETLGVNWKCKRCRISQNSETRSLRRGKNQRRLGGGSSIRNIFQQLAEHAQTQNPLQFKLPKDYPAYDYPFPGTSRHLLKMARQRTSVVDVENGVVPKPTVLCFHCQLSCRVGALIQCDKCDVYFHLDCLDPPLTTIPTTVWICPLHVEPHLESKLLTSVALSERVKIWEQSERPVNRPAVILDFIHKARKPNPMFRRKRPIPMLSYYNDVPEMVQVCYKNTQSLLQQRFEGLNALAYVCEMEKLHIEIKEEINNYREKMTNEYVPVGKSLVEHRAKLEFLRTRNISKLNHLRNVFEMYLKNRELKSAHASAAGPSQPKAPKVYESVTDILHEMNFSSKNDECDKRTEEATVASAAAAAAMPTPPLVQEKDVAAATAAKKHQDVKANSGDSEYVPQWVWNELKAADADVDADMKVLNELSRDVRKVGEMLIVKNEQKKNVKSEESVSSAKESVPRQAESNATSNGHIFQGISESTMRKMKGKSAPLPMDIIKSLPRKVVNKLAACHLRNALKKKALKEAAKSPKKVIGSEDNNLPKTQLFMQIENTGLVVEITKRCFSIGSGNDCDFKITDFVKCNRIEEMHAKVFFNPLENCFEILNYSPHGIIINNVRFGLGAMENPAKTNVAPSERQQDLEKMMEKRIEDYIRSNPDKLHNTDKTCCYCKPFPEKSLPKMYEGGVKLHPGHRLEIGCAKLLIQRIVCTKP